MAMADWSSTVDDGDVIPLPPPPAAATPAAPRQTRPPDGRGGPGGGGGLTEWLHVAVSPPPGSTDGADSAQMPPSGTSETPGKPPFPEGLQRRVRTPSLVTRNSEDYLPFAAQALFLVFA